MICTAIDNVAAGAGIYCANGIFYVHVCVPEKPAVPSCIDAFSVATTLCCGGLRQLQCG
jgi:hypothetical protein